MVNRNSSKVTGNSSIIDNVLKSLPDVGNTPHIAPYIVDKYEYRSLASIAASKIDAVNDFVFRGDNRELFRFDSKQNKFVFPEDANLGELAEEFFDVVNSMYNADGYKYNGWLAEIRNDAIDLTETVYVPFKENLRLNPGDKVLNWTKIFRET